MRWRWLRRKGNTDEVYADLIAAFIGGLLLVAILYVGSVKGWVTLPQFSIPTEVDANGNQEEDEEEDGS